MSGGHRARLVLKYRFVILLGMLTLLLLIAPALVAAGPGPAISRAIMNGALIAMLLSAVFAVSVRRIDAIIALSLTLPAMALQAISLFVPSEWAHVAGGVLSFVALGFVLVILLRHLFTSRDVTLDTIAASLCVFLLLGVFWAVVHTLTDAVIPGSFRFAYSADYPTDAMGIEGEQAIFTLYYSFVTLTTLGYGDVVPTSGPARMFAVVEAVTGQLYLTVLVARLVGLHIAQSLKKPS